MSLCINPHCPSPVNHDTLLFCQACHSELLLDARYRVIRKLGGGGFGKTYTVRDSTLYNSPSGVSDLKVLKVLTHNHPKYVELFRREAHVLSVIHHPGVPQVESDAYFLFYPHDSTEAVHCLVMEKIEGLDLKQYIAQRNAGISEKRAIQWLMQLAQILGEIHKRNFFHRDIKPANIMLRANGQLVLIDFGTAREVTHTYLSKQDAGQLTGLFSAGYSPLEQLNGHAILQSDFFALGRTVVYLLTGRNPSDLYDAHQNKLLWREHTTSISYEFADFLDTLMAESPLSRPPSAGVILGQLTKIYHNLFESDSSFLLAFPSDVTSEGVTEKQPEMDLDDPNATTLANPEHYQTAGRDFPVDRFPPTVNTPPYGNTSPVNPNAYGNTSPVNPNAYGNTSPVNPNAYGNTSPVNPNAYGNTSPVNPNPYGNMSPVNPNPDVFAPVIDPQFIDRCQQELTQIIGPVAAIICQRALTKDRSFSPEDFVRILARTIPDPKIAKEFQKRLLD